MLFKQEFRVGIGLTFKELKETYEKYKCLLVPERPERVIAQSKIKPDHWIDPSEVWEIKFQEFTRSMNYALGKEYLGQGISLRFPIVIGKRSDKRLEDATTVAAIIDIYLRSLSANSIK